MTDVKASSATRGLLLGGEALFAASAAERVTRVLMVGMLIAPALFVVVPLAPGAWTIATAVIALLSAPAQVFATVRGHWRGWLAAFGFAAVAAVSAAWSLDPSRSLRAAAVVAGFALAGMALVAAIAVPSPAQARRILGALAIGAAAGLVVLIASEIMSVFAGERRIYWIWRFHKTTMYGLLFAAVLLAPGLPLRAARAALLIIAAGTTLGLGKTSGVNLVIVLTAALLLPRLRGGALATFCALYAALALLAPVLIHPLFSAVHDNAAVRQPGVLSFVARLDLWRMVADHIPGAYWLGHGADTIRISFERIVTSRKYYDLIDLPSAHNVVFDLWYELGLLGVAAYLLGVFAAAAAVWRLPAKARLTGLVAFLAIVIELSVDHRIWLSWLLGAIAFAIAAVAIAARRYEPASQRMTSATRAVGEKFHSLGSANWGISPDVLTYAATLLPAAARTLETGAGRSTVFFAERGYRHTAITPSADEVGRIKAYCAENGIDLSRTDFIVAPSEDVIPHFTDAIDFFLIDGGHGFPVPQIDWYYGAKRLKVGGIIAIDDVHTWTGAILCDVLAEDSAWTALDVIDHKTAFFRLERPFGYREWNEQPYVLRESKRLIRRRKLMRFGERLASGQWFSLYRSFAGKK